MKKKVLTGIVVAMTVLTLTGCQSHTSASVKKTTGVGSVRKTGTSSKRVFGHNGSSNTDDSSVWNSEKQGKLDDFFDDWADSMDQEYEKYDGTGQIKTAAGEEFPKDFSRVQVNGQKATMSYEPDGKGDSDYNVVAIYNYDKNEGASHISYFFAFHSGQPIVLVDETTNGDYVQAKETANKDLINGFNAITAGKDASMPDSDNNDSTTSDSDADTEDVKLVGVFVGLLKSGNWFKGWLKQGKMYYGTDWDAKGKLKGYDYITANGDPTSYFWFKQNGNDVTVKFVDDSHAKSVAEAPIKTEHYTIDRLKSDYYVNSSQKAEVNGYVKALKPIEDADK